MTVMLLTEQHLEFLSFKGGCIGLPEPTPVKMPHCWKSCVTAQLFCYMCYRCHFDVRNGSKTVFNEYQTVVLGT